VVNVPGIEVTVLGCSGSYPAPPCDACSGYLVRAGEATIWMDCGNGTFANLQRHAAVSDLDAVVISHAHPDHCVDIYGLHVMYRYGLGGLGLPIYAPESVETNLRALVGDWGGAFTWHTVGDGDRVDVLDAELRFARTDHPLPTVATEIRHGGRRVAYTSDTGPRWSVGAFGRGADLVVSEASYLHRDIKVPIHLSARQAGEAARDAAAGRLVLTHLWPQNDRVETRDEAAVAYGADVTVAAVGDVYTV
jgi:ribonuclease BN (tRNA processing enzyme)